MNSRATKKSSEGFVLVWTAVLLTLLLLMAALAVDLGFWYRNKNNAQQAADAAAAAGVVYRSVNGIDDIPGATAAAFDAAKRNNVEVSEVEVVTTGIPANQLKVVVTLKRSNFFLNIVGMDETTVRATSVAEYEAPVALGSPSNVLGRQPGAADWSADSPGAGVPSSLWLDVHGPSTAVYNGDQYSTTNCALIDGRRPDVCAGGTTNLSNEKAGKSGYEYVLQVLPGGEGKPISVQAYDPAFAVTDPQCDDDSIKTTKQIIDYFIADAGAAYVRYQGLVSSIAAVESRLDQLIGWEAGGTTTTPALQSNGTKSDLQRLRDGEFGALTAPSFVFGSILVNAGTAAYRRQYEIQTPVRGSAFYSDRGLPGYFSGMASNVPLGNAPVWGNEVNKRREGTYFEDSNIPYTLPIGALPPTFHGDDVLTNTIAAQPAPGPAQPFWENHHDSAVDLLALQQRLTAEIAKTGVVNPALAIPNLDVFATGPWTPDQPVSIQQYCSGDTAFKTRYVDVKSNDNGPPCIGCPNGPSGHRKNSSTLDNELELTAGTPRPVTRFQVLQPGATELVDSSCTATFGGFTEAHDKYPPKLIPSYPDWVDGNRSQAGGYSEFFRMISKELGLRWVRGMNPKYWQGLLQGPTGAGNEAEWRDAFGNLQKTFISLNANGQLDEPNITDGYGHSFLSTFHQWVNLCTFTPTTAGDYRIVVDTNTASSAVGGNRFSLRAGQNGASGVSGEFVRLFAKERLNLLLNFADPTSPDNEVFMTRVLPASYDRTLELQLHDPGDIGACAYRTGTRPGLLGPIGDAWAACPYTGESVTARRLQWTADGLPVMINVPIAEFPYFRSEQATYSAGPTVDLTNLGLKIRLYEQGSAAPLSSCRWARGNSPATWTIASPCEVPVPFGSSSPGFQAKGTSATNGSLVTIQIPLNGSGAATGYNCTPTGLGCWIKAKYWFSGSFTASDGGPVEINAEDVTTWTAAIKGDPLRYVGN